MDSIETTNPTDVAVKDEVTEAEVTNDTTNEEAPSQAEETTAAPEDDTEEVEVDGAKYKVPKAVAPKIMMQADYTRKTQELAEHRRALETERQQFEMTARQQSEFMEDIASLKTVDQQLDQFKDVNWGEFARQNPTEAQAMWMRYQQIKDYRAGKVAEMDSKARAISEAREREVANARQKAHEALSKPDPSAGWDGKFDSEKSTKLTEFGKKLGFTQDELQSIASPVAIKALNLAMIGAQYLEQQRTAIKPKPVEAKPVPEVNTGRASPVAGSGLDDRLAADEWYARRQEQIARQAKRIRPVSK